MKRYHLDADFDRPWDLDDLQDLLHSMAWPVVTGFIVGFGLAIFLFIANVRPASHLVENSFGILVNSQERSL